MPPDQLGIYPEGRAAGRETQNTPTHGRHPLVDDLDEAVGNNRIEVVRVVEYDRREALEAMSVVGGRQGGGHDGVRAAEGR